jgi:hypothetical protein
MNLGAKARIEIAGSKNVLAKMASASRKALMKQGSYLRTVARNLIRSKPQPSAAGNPPRNVTGLLRNFIIYRYDPGPMSIVVGPALLGGSKNRNPTVPEILETGGTVMATVRRGKEWQKRRVAVAARPYMAPAKDRSQEKLNQFWKESLIT